MMGRDGEDERGVEGEIDLYAQTEALLSEIDLRL